MDKKLLCVKKKIKKIITQETILPVIPTVSDTTLPTLPTLPGVILIFSCNKYKETRLKEFKLQKTEYAGWKVFIIIGNPFLDSDYIIEDNIITIKCEDSYIHLLKKVVLAFKVILELYNITNGILRCGDDLLFNEQKLISFINNTTKLDYMGNISYRCSNIGMKKDMFMVDYYNSHQDDLLDPMNGINFNLDEIKKFDIRPTVTYISGVLIYFSQSACQLLINHLENIKWDIFKKDNNYGYPYIIEDIGIGYILKKENITATICPLWTNKMKFINSHHVTFAVHTNKYK